VGKWWLISSQLPHALSPALSIRQVNTNQAFQMQHNKYKTKARVNCAVVAFLVISDIRDNKINIINSR
jgi:hypothetical protein